VLLSYFLLPHEARNMAFCETLTLYECSTIVG
jgi:hypothetical protein